MFKKTDPQQNLFGVDTALPPGMRVRLKASWAEVFRVEILPILMRSEEDFAILYGISGRPNFSVGRMLGLCLLQELCGLCDQEALDAFGFDARWQYALDINADEDAYLSRRSLVEFRRRLVEKDPEMILMRRLFETISNAAINKLGLSVREQRLDSTQVASNIHTHGRIDLFQSTIKLFIRSLTEVQYAKLPAWIRTWFEEESNGWFGLGSEKQKKEKQHRLASILHRLIVVFENDKEVNTGKEYLLLVQLFGEHCELKPQGSNENQTSSDKPSTGDDSTSGNEKDDEPTIQIKKNSKGDTLQSPHDPDASYGHKGVGYSVQIAETCNNENSPEIITAYEVHGAARSDKGKAVDIVEQLEDTPRKPETLFTDGGYPTVPSVPKVLKHDVELIAPVDRGKLAKDVMGRDRFEFDEQGHVTKCPAGNGPVGHRILSNGEKQSLHAVFDGDTCRCCDMLDKCPVRAPNHRKKGQSPRETVGNFRLEITPELRLRDEMYAQQQTLEWKERYKIRSGIEATMSEAKRYGMGKLRVRGLPRVHFSVVCKVIACNIRRLARAVAGSGLSAGIDGASSSLKNLIYAPIETLLAILCNPSQKKQFFSKST